MSDPHPIVVLIEDEPQIRRFLRAVLPSQGIELFEAETGRKAWSRSACAGPTS